MASLGHIAVGMAAARLHRRAPPPDGEAPRPGLLTALALWSALSMLPDADVLGFRFGVAYGDPWGHRGASHSLLVAGALGALIGVASRLLGGRGLRTGLLAAAVVASHGLLDTLTDGGLGVALLWPFDLTRLFAPVNPIPVAPIGRAFFTARGLSVALTEVALFSPLFLYALWPRRAGRRGGGEGAP